MGKVSLSDIILRSSFEILRVRIDKLVMPVVVMSSIVLMKHCNITAVYK